MDREQAEQQAKVWQWATGHKVTQCSGCLIRGETHWHDTVRGAGWGMKVPDLLTLEGNAMLRRAIEAKKWDMLLENSAGVWRCELFPPDWKRTFTGEGDSLEQALYAAALAAADGRA